MIDVSSTIQANSQQMNADDIIGKPITVKITKVSLLAGDQPISIHYEGDDGKPWKPCKSMRRVLVGVWGSDGNAYVGRSLTLYRDDTVTFGGQAVGGIRISHMSHIEQAITMSLTATKKSKKPFTVKPLKTAPAISAPALDYTNPLFAIGDKMAAKGVQEYAKWLGTLSDDEKKPIRVKHKEWTAIAKEADSKQQEDDLPL